MAAPRTDSRARRSRAALVAAMRDTIREGRTDGMTVSALCLRAGVSRPTFYEHFSSPGELVVEAIRERLAEAQAAHEAAHATGHHGGSAGVPATGAVECLVGEVDRERTAYGGMLADPAVFGLVRATIEEWLTERIGASYPEADPLDVAFVAGGAARVLAVALGEPDRRFGPRDVEGDLRRLVVEVLGEPGADAHPRPA